MWRESYTNVMERGVQNKFAACDRLVACNHATWRKQYSSPKAVQKEIFRTDIDVLSWDSGRHGRESWHAH
jgi:hypothetical protein